MRVLTAAFPVEQKLQLLDLHKPESEKKIWTFLYDEDDQITYFL